MRSLDELVSYSCRLSLLPGGSLYMHGNQQHVLFSSSLPHRPGSPRAHAWLEVKVVYVI